jgi:hypothetical protein
MNGYERHVGVLKGQPVDCLPRTPILMQYAAEYIGSDYAAFASDYRVLVKANAGCEIPSGTPVENLKALCAPIPYRR